MQTKQITQQNKCGQSNYKAQETLKLQCYLCRNILAKHISWESTIAGFHLSHTRSQTALWIHCYNKFQFIFLAREANQAQHEKLIAFTTLWCIYIQYLNIWYKNKTITPVESTWVLGVPEYRTTCFADGVCQQAYAMTKLLHFFLS